jgi:hypothetical protein
MATEQSSKRSARGLHVRDGLRVQVVRGLLHELREAGHVPAELEVDELARAPVEWSDAQGRRHRLRPYGTYPWEAVTYRLEHEIEEQRRAEAAAQARWEDAHMRAKRRARLEQAVAQLPACVADYRAGVLQQARSFAGVFQSLLFGKGDDCLGSIDAASRAEVDEALSAMLEALDRARFTFNRGAADRLRAELRALEARDDEQLQAFLEAQGAAVRK